MFIIDCEVECLVLAVQVKCTVNGLWKPSEGGIINTVSVVLREGMRELESWME